MRKTNEWGIYPTIMLHHSNYIQLAIGGAMLNRIHENEEEAECYQCTPTGSSGWHTRFDGGSRPGPLDMPCDLVAIYLEGQMNISGFEGAYDSDVVVDPLCFAVVVFRSPEVKNYMGTVTRKSKQEYVYLWSVFSFIDRIRHDGVYDLKEAFETARKGGPLMTQEERWQRPSSHNGTFDHTEREWHIIGKARVPGRIRQILHRTINSVKETVDGNFGQGSKFFRLPRKPKKTRSVTKPATVEPIIDFDMQARLADTFGSQF